MSRNIQSHEDLFHFSYRNDEELPENLNLQHCHQLYEILYVVNGKGSYFVEGVEYPVRPRTIILIPPLFYHRITLEGETSYERFVINFSPSDLVGEAASVLSSFSKSENEGAYYYSQDAVSGSIISIFDRFDNIKSLPEQEAQLYKKLLLSELVLLISLADRYKSSVCEGELGARVIRYLNEHIHKNISLDRLSKKFFVSKYYLCRAFKKYNGISIHGYINQKRVLEAKQLIEDGETASSAAYKVGFGDYSAFYRAYVKLIGRSPTQDGAEVEHQ
jgi:AraC-like DNA-binding protein/mannose-6-phosphate isomerase-like protein (cupin superfamily)